MNKLIIDFENEEIQILESHNSYTHKFSTEKAFNAVAQAYLRLGWDNKYVYSFKWLGRPIIQLPDDIIRLQELIYEVKPDVIIDIGIAHGGSLIFNSTLLKTYGGRKVIGIDIDIREKNLKAIKEHKMFDQIELIQGNSTSDNVFFEAKNFIKESDKVMVFLDGKHTYDHVYKELEMYSKLITKGSYIVAMDGIQRDLVGAPRSNPDWQTNNPANAAEDFVKNNKNYEIDLRLPSFNEGNIKQHVTYWPSAYIKKIND